MLFEIIIFLAILMFLVFIHELGHFYTAKKFGIRVEEFGLGLPPRAIGKKIGDTIYSLNWLPLGGFVQIKGENFDDTYDPQDKENFMNKKPWQRSVVLLAGIFMNLVFAVLIFYVSLGFNNWNSAPMVSLKEYEFPFGQTIRIPNIVLNIKEGSAAEKSGIELGDRLLSLEYEGQVIEVKDVQDIRAFLADKENKEISVNIINMATGIESTKKFIPEYNEELKQPALGVSLDSGIKISYEKPTDKIFSGLFHATNLVIYNVEILKSLAGISIAEKTVEPIAQSVSGPIGIFDVVKTILNTQSEHPFLAILDIAGIISLSLAIMNLLPIPALDGGRVVFVLIEWISGRKVSQKIEATLHHYGFMFLIALIILITFKDVWMIWTR
jgi:regulator of sigma E protease